MDDSTNADTASSAIATTITPTTAVQTPASVPSSRRNGKNTHRGDGNGSSASRMMVEEYEDVMKDYDPTKNVTSPIMTRFERAKVLGLRTEQIARGSHVLVDVDIVGGNESPAEIAARELRDKRTPFVIVRSLPNGEIERWRVTDMIIPSS